MVLVATRRLAGKAQALGLTNSKRSGTSRLACADRRESRGLRSHYSTDERTMISAYALIVVFTDLCPRRRRAVSMSPGWALRSSLTARWRNS
jgi:hypothetical protein